MRTLVAPVLIGLAILAQATTRKPVRPTSADAGVRSRAAQRAVPGDASDAGDVPAAPRSGDAAVQGAGGGPAQLELLRRQVTALQARTDALEQQLQRDQQQRERLLEQVQQLVRQGADREQREAQQRAGAEDTQRSVSGLLQIQTSLSGGNLDVDSAMGDAQGGLPPQAQRDLEAARQAVRNHDLYNARVYLSQAIADAQAGR